MTQSIIAVDAGEVRCTECGNDRPERFSSISTPHWREGRIVGYTLSGITCMRCGTSRGLDYELANSSWH